MNSSWEPKAGAAHEEIAKLVTAAGYTLPESYLAFLCISNGGQGPLSVDPFWLILDSADSVAGALKIGTFTEFFPGLIVIGGNGAGEGVAFDFRSNREAEVVHFDMTNTDHSESVRPFAASFTELLALVGESGS
ncbi:SMI1/KNR4 family protein [Loktanella salsilacus]|uniref:SMI1/KNR4 family protein n=1 Tax=Loktanella salsilacus TaxID=195913 RepID=UPI0037365149